MQTQQTNRKAKEKRERNKLLIQNDRTVHCEQSGLLFPFSVMARLPLRQAAHSGI